MNNTAIMMTDLERWMRIAEDTKKEIAFNKAIGTWSWSNRGDLASHGPFKTYAGALYDAVEPYLWEEAGGKPAGADETTLAPVKDQVHAAIAVYAHALCGMSSNDSVTAKKIFDDLYTKLEKIMGPYHVAKKWKAVAEEVMGHFDAEGLAASIVDKIVDKLPKTSRPGNLPQLGDMITYLQIARIALDRDDIRDQLVEEMTLTDSEVTRLIEVLNKNLDT